MKTELIEALKQLARGRVDAAETVADLLLPEPKEAATIMPQPEPEAKPKKK